MADNYPNLVRRVERAEQQLAAERRWGKHAAKLLHWLYNANIGNWEFIGGSEIESLLADQPPERADSRQGNLAAREEGK